jgi:frataxin-like iron-binding protein CyaY
MTQEETNSFLYKIESLTHEFPNDYDLGAAVREVVISLEKERGTKLVFNKPTNTPDNWGDADED